MKKISRILLVLGCLFMMSSCKYTKAERQILNQYEELTTSDYVDKYDFLEDTNNVFKSISLEDLIKKLEKDTFVLYVGGAWCPNCQAIVKFVNDVAKANNISTVYNFDTRISSLKTKERNSNIECLRILAMFVIVLSHSFTHGGYSKEISSAILNTFFIEALQLGSIGVNIFISYDVCIVIGMLTKKAIKLVTNVFFI
jgi:thiol-disulfide isomerase/thioredoxin